MMSTRPATGEAVALWPDGAPYANGQGSHDQPTLTAYWPLSLNEQDAPHPAVIICPGGGYGMLAPHEGEGYARWLSMFGIVCFVLEYRLGTQGYHHPVQRGEAARALRFVRAHAEAWNVDPARLGIMGSSAGGHLAATAMTHFDTGDAGAADTVDRASSRPDFGILCYPVITMGEHAHEGSRLNLFGEDRAADPDLIRELSAELNVTADTPPAFIWHTATDPVVPAIHALLFAGACDQMGVSYELHMYDRGPHGIGLDNGHLWTEALLTWLRVRRIARDVWSLQQT